MKAIAKKLLEIKKHCISLKRNTKAYNYFYATLDQIQKELNPILDELELVIFHKVENNKVITSVVDIESWESIQSEIEISTTKPQDQWSEITYYRRYNLVCLFDLVVEDDDWKKAQDSKKTTSAIDRSKFTMTNLRKLDATIKAKDREPKTWDELIKKVKETHYIPEDIMLDLEMYKDKRWLK